MSCNGKAKRSTFKGWSRTWDVFSSLCENMPRLEGTILPVRVTSHEKHAYPNFDKIFENLETFCLDVNVNYFELKTLYEMKCRSALLP